MTDESRDKLEEILESPMQDIEGRGFNLSAAETAEHFRKKDEQETVRDRAYEEILDSLPFVPNPEDPKKGQVFDAYTAYYHLCRGISESFDETIRDTREMVRVSEGDDLETQTLNKSEEEAGKVRRILENRTTRLPFIKEQREKYLLARDSNELRRDREEADSEISRDSAENVKAFRQMVEWLKAPPTVSESRDFIKEYQEWRRNQ